MAVFFRAQAELVLCAPGYETDERSSLGERGERRRWREKRPERVAGVGEGRRRSDAEDIRRAPQQGRYAEPLLVYVQHKGKSSRVGTKPQGVNPSTTAKASIVKI